MAIRSTVGSMLESAIGRDALDGRGRLERLDHRAANGHGAPPRGS